ncbi:MAG: hypothetical protein M3N47_10475 [Chloroflexota bacterium]|nr:hypothetical protein [Chloroflexota bacterium]
MAAGASESIELYARFCRGTALAFALVAVYTVVVKAPTGEIEHDWVHTALHLLTGAVAAYAGWFAADVARPRLFAVAILVGYGVLGVLGWFVDGLFLHTSFRIPLDVADNVFHLLLAAAAATVIGRAPAISDRGVY